MLPILDSLDNYKILSERMNVLRVHVVTIYLPFRKLPVASNLRIVKTAVQYNKSQVILIHVFDLYMTMCSVYLFVCI